MGPGGKRAKQGGKPKPAIGLGSAHCQNVINVGAEFDLEKTLSKIKDEPTMLMKINELKNYKMPDATMFLSQKDLASIRANLIKMC
jgi:hypothetical protein